MGRLYTVWAWGVCAVLASQAAAEEVKSPAYDITIPAVPKQEIAIPEVAPVRVHYEKEAVAAEEAQTSSTGPDRSIVFSKRTPPDWGKEEHAEASAEAKVGEVNGGKVSLYLRGGLMDENEVVSALQKAGFKVLGQFPVDKKKRVVSIVFTDDELQKAAAGPNRGFAASLRVVVDHNDKQISIMNPLYVSKAFLQEEFNEAAAAGTLEKIRAAFSGLKDSEDRFKFDQLPKYHFMDAMPYYQDMVEVGAGDTAALLEKARASKQLAFEQPLPNGSVLVGVKLGSRTSKFVKKIGYHNAGLLPYPVLIENGKARILEPKYYIAVMYPMLSMSNFMTIATVPGAIGKECDKIFR